MVDDGTGTKKYRLVSLCAPIVSLSALVAVFLCARTLGYVVGTVIVCILIPSVPASYYTFKHFILPPDVLGFLSVMRIVNACILMFYGMLFASVIVLLYNNTAGNILSMITAFLSALISILAVKGERQWIQLI